ncbi:NYN domain protein [mine drainage metagenome]|uniref:NYN domain protein n=1 Tax=mine drainage metagenome TaxID=410659 RepID=A0A1J5NW70_9ZZZZ
MPFLPNERVALFIDGANLYSASRNLGFDVDYRNLLEYFRKQANVIRAYYYSAVLETEEYSPLKPLTDWLAYNGYALVTKPAKEFTDAARPGAYLRVIEDGRVAADDLITVVRRPTHGFTIGQAFKAKSGARELVPRVLDASELPESWHEWARRVLDAK